MIDYEKLFNKAKAYAKSRGINNEDADEFGQECCISSLNSKEGYIKLDWALSNFRQFHKADKRILSSSQGQLSGFRTISADAPIDNSDPNSTKLGDLIADSRDEFGSLEECGEIELFVKEILSWAKPTAEKWAMNTYLKYLGELV